MEAKEFSYEKALLFFAKSKYADLFGVALVIAIAVASGYLSTRLDKYVDWGPITAFIPLGVISVINVGISMMSTRLTGRLSNIGNVLGIINTALSGAIDYILGNKAAIITYPVTFIVYTFAIRRWQNSERGKAMEPPTGKKGQLIISGIVVGSFAFSLIANYVGYYLIANNVGYDGKTSFLFWITTAVFGLSLSANILNALKLTMQWQFWFPVQHRAVHQGADPGQLCERRQVHLLHHQQRGSTAAVDPKWYRSQGYRGGGVGGWFPSAPATAYPPSDM